MSFVDVVWVLVIFGVMGYVAPALRRVGAWRRVSLAGGTVLRVC